jgi:hypothetical protein
LFCFFQKTSFIFVWILARIWSQNSLHLIKLFEWNLNRIFCVDSLSYTQIFSFFVWFLPLIPC